MIEIRIVLPNSPNVYETFGHLARETVAGGGRLWLREMEEPQAPPPNGEVTVAAGPVEVQ